MLWNAFVVLLTAFAVLIGTRAGVRYNLLHALDEILIEDLQEIRIAVKPEIPSPLSTELAEQLDRKAKGHVHHQWFVQFLKADNSELHSSGKAPELHPNIKQIKDLTPISSEGYRLVQLHLNDEQGNPVTVRVGASLKFLKADMARLDALFVLVAGVILIFAPLCGYWLAGRAINPLADIINTTARLRPSQLDERLPIRNTGDELDKLSKTVNGLLDRIAEHLAQKHDFLANSAHELRTPIAAIRSSVEVALDAHRPSEEYEEILVEVIEECSALEVLVSQLLLIAETETDQIKIYGEPVAWHELVERSIDMFQAVAESREITLDLMRCDEAIVDGYPHHLRQVLNNLLDNAIKFTPEGGRITVELSADPSESTCKLVVSDTGRGIAPDDLPHIFDRFFRGDRSRSQSPTTRGTGLGLSICQAVVTAHQGEIHADSEYGKGTTFTVTLPLSTEPAGIVQPV
jgi:heavy metal sensor kinase